MVWPKGDFIFTKTVSSEEKHGQEVRLLESRSGKGRLFSFVVKLRAPMKSWILFQGGQDHVGKKDLPILGFKEVEPKFKHKRIYGFERGTKRKKQGMNDLL